MDSRRNPLALCVALVAVGAASVLAQSSLSNFGINSTDLQPKIVNALVTGYVPVYPNRKQFFAASPALRAGFVKDALSFTKAYTESASFLEHYRKEREAARPVPSPSQATPDERYAKYLADQRKGIQEMKQNVAKMPPDMQNQMAETVKQMEANADRQAKDPQMIAMMKQNFAVQEQADQKDHQERLANFEKRFPADPRTLIASRLRQFLDLSKDVDFSAKLVPAGGGKMRFADPRYEAKPPEWKLCYRAGKDAVDAARTFAADWLRQLSAK